MADELIYNVPLRREWLKAPPYRRTKKAVRALRAFIAKHTKSEEVKIGKYLNLMLWEHGRKNPPGKITVKVTKEKDFVKVELPDAPEEKVEEPKKKGIFAKRKEKKEEQIDEKKAEEEKEKKDILEHPPKEKKEKEVSKPKEERPEIEEKIREQKIIKRTQKKDTVK
ncbi:60S ribosomal protein L31 [Candidatus Woesearchaeota archaeon]|nr:60S ribosomal protein L31 [Candidatus Woesearchaeota archaeon]